MAFNVQLKRSSVAEKRPVAANMLDGEVNININAASAGLFFKDSTGGVVKVGPTHVGPTAPNSAPAGSVGNGLGEMWYDTSSSILKIFNGTVWEDLEAGLVRSVSGDGAITVDNTDPANPVVSVDAATVGSAGVVQLNDTTTSTSTTEALTANQGRVLQEQINALSVTSNITLAGTLDPSTGLLTTVTTAGTAAGFSVGSALPAAAVANAGHFVISDAYAAAYAAPGAASTEVHVGDWFLSDSTSYQFLDVGFQAGAANTTEAGVVRLSTNLETQNGSDATIAVTPASLQSKLSDSDTLTASASIASSTAVKSARDAADAAQTTANAAVVDAATAQAAAVAAQSTADGAVSAAAAAQATADQAILDAAAALAAAIAAQNTADSAVTAAAAAQSTADNAAAAAAAAQATADAAIPKATVTAKGDLVVGTGAAAVTNLSAGATGQVLMPDSSTASGLAWVSTDAGLY